jgi:hypothetical protein
MYDSGFIERFWSRVQRCTHGWQCAACCWEWQGLTNRDGYGIFNIPPAYRQGKWHKARAHRLAYSISFGAFDKQVLVCHRCDNRPCCNPWHLWLGTSQDNARDTIAKDRHVNGIQKLSRQDQRIIMYARAQQISATRLALLFGVSYQAIRAVQADKIRPGQEAMSFHANDAIYLHTLRERRLQEIAEHLNNVCQDILEIRKIS